MSKPSTSRLVRDLMQIGVTTCPAQTPVVEAVQILLKEELESLIVLDENGHAIGLFSRREAIAAYGHPQGYDNLTVAEVARPDIPEAPPDIPATAAAQLMLDQNVRELYLMHHDSGIGWPAAKLGFAELLRHLTAETEADLADMGAKAARKTPMDIFRERYKGV